MQSVLSRQSVPEAVMGGVSFKDNFLVPQLNFCIALSISLMSSHEDHPQSGSSRDNRHQTSPPDPPLWPPSLPAGLSPFESEYLDMMPPFEGGNYQMSQGPSTPALDHVAHPLAFPEQHDFMTDHTAQFQAQQSAHYPSYSLEAGLQHGSQMFFPGSTFTQPGHPSDSSAFRSHNVITETPFATFSPFLDDTFGPIDSAGASVPLRQGLRPHQPVMATTPFLPPQAFSTQPSENFQIQPDIQNSPQLSPVTGLPISSEFSQTATRFSPSGAPPHTRFTTAMSSSPDRGAQHSTIAPVAPIARRWSPGPYHPDPASGTGAGTMLRHSPSSKRVWEADSQVERRVAARRSGSASAGSSSGAVGSPSGPISSTMYARGPIVPQGRYKPGNTLDHNMEGQKQAVIFNLENPREEGIPLADALARRFDRLENRSTPVLADVGSVTVSLRIEWPGYASWSGQISSKNWKKTRGPPTREAIAHKVAKHVRRFIEDRQNKQYENKWTKNWSVGQNGIELQDLVLVALRHVSAGSWQPELRLIRDI
ncbi:hypothetical protein BV22DRAFT_474630 [Leucogyrophana mollusca]|uniref:Uncharacterized protein n=1 Tax=Leucogyrophana mollusca TaxID=85980 RepID=A0ACB8BJC5_9AGAM|nr:hypothetical protein BV22DRAFT_474630 [Leucogyrophana mollusca]